MPQSKSSSNCKNIGGKMVCVMLHSGGKAHKNGIFRLAKGERVMSASQLKYFGKTKKTSEAHKKKRDASVNTKTPRTHKTKACNAL